MKTAALYERALALAQSEEQDFLKLATAFRHLYDADAEEFRRCIKNSGYGQRKAYCLVRIHRWLDKTSIPKMRLKKIGWTKLNLLTMNADKKKWSALLTYAEHRTAKELEAVLRAEEPIKNAHSVLLYFSPKDYQLFADALVKHGAVRSGRRLLHKEDAIINLIHSHSETIQLDG